MGKSNDFINDFMKLIFNGTAIANLADNAASSPLTDLYVALHTADPGAAGNQTTSEISYTSYARVAVSRNSGGWTVTGQTVSPTLDIDFPISTGGIGGTATHASIGIASSGAGKILWSGALSPTIAISNGTPPVLVQGSTITES
ncbi:phage tail fiber protein [Bradyrhizobium liaoningense]